jgi:hypothetical protein
VRRRLVRKGPASYNPAAVSPAPVARPQQHIRNTSEFHPHAAGLAVHRAIKLDVPADHASPEGHHVHRFQQGH